MLAVEALLNHSRNTFEFRADATPLSVGVFADDIPFVECKAHWKPLMQGPKGAAWQS